MSGGGRTGLSDAVRRHLETAIVYRGQWCGTDALASELSAIAFGSATAASTYATSPNQADRAPGAGLASIVFAARLSMKRPYCLTHPDDCDPFLDLDVVGAEFGREVFEAIIRDKGDAIVNTNAFEEMTEETGRSLEEMVAAWPDAQAQLPPIEAYHAIDTPEFLAAVKAAGYDGMAFGGSGETMMEMEWHIFDAAQARSAFGDTPLIDIPEPDQMAPEP